MTARATSSAPRLRGEQVEVRLIAETVEISQRGRLLRTWPARHDRTKDTAPSRRRQDDLTDVTLLVTQRLKA